MSKKIFFLVTMIIFLSVMPILAQGGSSTSSTSKTSNVNIEFTLNFTNGSMSPICVPELCNREKFYIQIDFDEDINNFSIEISGMERKTMDEAITKASGIISKSIEIPIIHNPGYSSYQVKVTKKSGGESRTWVIPVTTLKWTVGFSGGFAVSPKWGSYKNPVYFLEPGVNPSTNENGYFVRRNKDAEDNIMVTPLTMVHVYHTKYKRFLGLKHFSFVPVTIGIGINSETNTKFFLGTGLRLGEEFFLTIGGTVSQLKRLPDNLIEEGFTTNNSALANMPNKSKLGAFISLTYAFAGGTAKDKFLQPFVSSSNEEKPDSKTK